MAIDTETKRRSVSGYTEFLINPVADGTINARERMHMAWLYGGIDPSPPTPPVLAVGVYIPTFRPRRR